MTKGPPQAMQTRVCTVAQTENRQHTRPSIDPRGFPLLPLEYPLPPYGGNGVVTPTHITLQACAKDSH